MTPEARAARERKQKIFVAVGGLLLVGMLAIQLPKILGGSSSPEAAPVTTTDASGLTVVQAAPTGAAPVALVAASPEAAKNTSFSVFTRKDPFVQQVTTQSAAVAPEGSGKTAEKGNGSAGDAPTKEFATGKPAAVAATIVTVNGARQVLEPGARFPAGDPLFVLVAEKPDSKAVVVGIVGGAYAGGAKTTTLRVGKSLTLVNTVTGAKYKISLVSVGSGDVVEQTAPQP